MLCTVVETNEVPQISTAAGDEVLISSPNFGIVDTDMLSSSDQWFNDFERYATRLAVACASYAEECYNTNAAPQECSIFTKKALSSTVNRNASCPFPGGDKICAHLSGNVLIDTGLLNSHADLGMNAEPNDRIAYRRVDACAPLLSDEYTTVQILANRFGTYNMSYLVFSYGNSTEIDPNTYYYPSQVNLGGPNSSYYGGSDYYIG